MATETFYVWATLLSDRAADRLVAGLVRRGFQVETLSSRNEMTLVGEASALVALKIIADHRPADAAEPHYWVSTQTRDALDSAKDVFYSLVVYHIGGTCTWNGSNITLPKERAPAKKPEKEPEKKTTALDKMDKSLQE